MVRLCYIVAFCSHCVLAVTSILLSLYVKELGASVTQIGLVCSAFFLGALISAPLWGFFSDRTGKRKLVILLSMIGEASSCFLIIITRNILLLTLIQFLFGAFFVANRPILNTLIIESSPPNKKGRSVGFLNIARESAWTTGCILAGTIGNIGLIYTFYAGLIISTTGLFASSFLKEIDRKESTEQYYHSCKEGFSPYIWVIRTTLAFLYVSKFIQSCAQSGAYKFLPIYFASLNITRTGSGIIFASESIIEVFLFPLIGKFSDKVRNGPKLLMIMGFLSSTMSLFLFSVFHTVSQFFIPQVFIAISWASFIVGATVFISEQAPRERQMEAMGLLDSFANMGGILGPIIFAQLLVITKSFVSGLRIVMILPILSTFIIMTKLKKKVKSAR